MVDILVTGSILYTGESVVKDGYVYVKNGRIIDLGGGGPPEDYTYATLLLGGPGRIIAPGLTAIIDAPAYPIRFLRPTLGSRVRLYHAMDDRTALTAALPAVYEAHLAGITRVVTEYTGPSLPYSLSNRVGGLYGLALPACTSQGVPEALPSVAVSGEGCEGEAPLQVVGDEAYHGGEPVLALLRRTSYTRLPEDAYERSIRLRSLMGLPERVLEPGNPAELVVYNVARPPAMFLDYAGEEAIRKVYSSGARVESLVSGETVVVDQGDHLYIVERDFREARALLGRLLERR